METARTAATPKETIERILTLARRQLGMDLAFVAAIENEVHPELAASEGQDPLDCLFGRRGRAGCLHRYLQITPSVFVQERSAENEKTCAFPGRSPVRGMPSY